MRRGRALIERIDRDRPEHTERHRHRFLECGAALRLLDVMRERRPRQFDARALRLGRGRLRLGAANCRHAAFAAGDALRGLVQIADRALAADRAIIEMRRRNAEPLCQLLLRIAVAPAQEVDDVERLQVGEQFCAAVGLGALQRFLEQGEGLEAGRDILRTVDDLADADDDGNAVFGDAVRHSCCFTLRYWNRCLFEASLRGAKRRSNPSIRIRGAM
ncbi:hypothetical protein chiPu_0030355, partial [Chiloscyllium punctatum]|nr:hypothetical protein [Chiloscyllium punctatum]